MPENNSTLEGVILLTYGSATTSANVPEYLAHVYRGKEPSPEIVAEFKRRFDLIGKSPLVEITRAQKGALQKHLDTSQGEGRYVVEVGMLHSEPFIAEGVAALRRKGAERITGIILSPQFSSLIMDGYRKALHEAGAASGYREEDVRIADPWPSESGFIEYISKEILTHDSAIPIIFTTHSLPKRVVEKDPGYLDQLKETTDAVMSKAGLSSTRCRSAYQSAGHSPEEWLKPDLTDVLRELHDAKEKDVLIVPLQFLSDHLEILYDLDIAAKKQCEDFGITYRRIKLPNTDPLFIQTLGRLVTEN